VRPALVLDQYRISVSTHRCFAVSANTIYRFAHLRRYRYARCTAILISSWPDQAQSSNTTRICLHSVVQFINSGDAEITGIPSVRTPSCPARCPARCPVVRLIIRASATACTSIDVGDEPRFHPDTHTTRTHAD